MCITMFDSYFLDNYSVIIFIKCIKHKDRYIFRLNHKLIIFKRYLYKNTEPIPRIKVVM